MKSLKKVRKTIFKKEMKMMKKALYVGLAVAIIAMFSIPSMLFAEEGDTTTYVKVDDSEVIGGIYVGQYVMGNSVDTISDSEGDGDTEVFCIDGDITLTSANDAYVLTDENVSEVLEGEDAKYDDDDKDGTPYYNDANTVPINVKQIDGEIDKVEAEVVEILSTEATGATSVEDQVAVWTENGDRDITIPTSSSSDQGNVDKIMESVEALATDYLDSSYYANDGNGGLEQFLDSENVNEIDVTVEQADNMFELDDSGNAINSGTATATMENPLVPGVTDQDKNITWYILAGAFNISFSADRLVTEIASKDSAAVEKMTDYEDDSDAESGIDNDGDGKLTDDHYGMARVPYYYFNWGMTEYPEDTMCVNIFAWVDIDEDDKFDIVDVDPLKTNDGSDPDGAVLEDFQANHQVVEVDDNGEVKTDSNGVVTKAIFTEYNEGTGKYETDESAIDVHKIEGGKVIIENNDDSVRIDSEGKVWIKEEYEHDYQRFSTIAYTESYDEDPQFWGTIIFKKDDGGSPLSGAVFSVYENVDDSGSPTGDAVATFTSGDDGYADVSGLEWGTYYIVETTAPDGYVGDSTVYALTVNGTGVAVISLGNEEGLDIPFHIINTPPPPTPPKPPTDPPADPPTTTTAVAGIIEVAGITELPFTGMNPIIPLSGISIMVIGAALLAVSLIRRKRIIKMEA